MLAEFEDASYASDVVSHGRKVNEDVKLQSVTVSVDLFRPDLAERILSQQIYSPTTPTRYPGDDTDLHNGFGNMSLRNFTLSPDSPGNNHTGMSPNAPGMPYLPTPSRYPLPGGHTLALGGAGTMYMPPVINSFHHGYTPRIELPGYAGLGESAVHSFKSHPSPQSGLPRQGVDSIAGFQNPNMVEEFDYYNQSLRDQAHEFSYCSRPTGRRPFVPRVGHVRSRQHTSPANSHHNHVDIAKIRQGIDVRTTVNIIIILCRVLEI
jgi:hypothetical protein